jgi:hypothetical protein
MGALGRRDFVGPVVSRRRRRQIAQTRPGYRGSRFKAAAPAAAAFFVPRRPLPCGMPGLSPGG